MKLDTDTLSIGTIVFIAIAAVIGYVWMSNRCQLTSNPPFVNCLGGGVGDIVMGAEGIPTPVRMSPQEEIDTAAMYAHYY